MIQKKDSHNKKYALGKRVDTLTDIRSSGQPIEGVTKCRFAIFIVYLARDFVADVFS